MKKKTEIIYKDKSIETIDELLNLQAGDIFYFSVKGTSPRSESNYYELHPDYKESFVVGLISEINKESEELWIKEFKVVKITKSYEKNYRLSIDNPEIIYVESIIVEDYIKE